MPEQSSIEARREEIYKWIEPGFDVEVDFSTSGKPKYHAILEEFGFVGEGETFDAAYDAVIERVTLTELIATNQPLPDRSAWLARQQKISDGGDG